MKIDFKQLFLKNKEFAQLIYGALLIILIVGLISFNSYYIITKYKKGLDTSLYHQAFFTGRSIYTLIKDDLADDKVLQNKIENLMDKNSEIDNLTILRPTDDSFEIVASSEKENIGEETSFYLYKFAWNQPDYEGVATDSFSTNFVKSEDDREMLDKLQNGGGYWFVALPMFNNDGEKVAIFSIMISSEFENTLTRQNQVNSLFITLGTIVVVILFLSLTLRLWDYVLMYKKAKEVDQMKDEFISMASHELRTPVTIIKGYTSLILDGSYGHADDEVVDSITKIDITAKRLHTLVEDLLNVSRIEQSRMTIELKTQDISKIIEETIEEFKIVVKEKGLELKYNFDQKSLPLILVDADKLRQVLVNIIGNSVKYTQKGSVEIITEVKNGKILEIKIKDTGIGMATKDRESLFLKFYRIKNKSTENIVGTGLGLWITKKLVNLMKGTISVDSMEGVGTQFSISFPIVKK